MLDTAAPTQTIVYAYGNSSWTDLLTSYNGQNIAYDAIGNPTSYLGYTLKWNGRQLSSLSGNGVTASYKYDADGLRSYKKVGNTESTYQYVGDKLMYEKRGTTEFFYYYNSFGNLAGIKYYVNGTRYMVYAICNTRGDVEDLYWGSGNLACHYTYDTWGNVISVTDINGNEITNENNIGLMNPIRYRGYYYDSEIGMYYLQSRYYNPQVGRFLNVDAMIKAPGDSVLSTNMFAYCANNPVICSDSTGQWFGLDDLIAGGVGAVVGVASQLASDVIASAVNGSWQFSSWQTYVGAGVGGAIGGVTTLYAGPIVGAAVGAGSSTLIGQTLENITGGQKHSTAEIAINTVVDATIGTVVSKFAPVKMSGITSGRNSMAAVFKSGLTKLGNGTASKMSMKVVGKGFVSGFVGDLSLTFIMGAKIFRGDSGQLYQTTITPRAPIYWCEP